MQKVEVVPKTAQQHLDAINKRRAFALGATGVGIAMVTPAHAEIDVSSQISGSKANDNVDAAGTFVIGVVLGLFAIGVIRRALGK